MSLLKKYANFFCWRLYINSKAHFHHTICASTIISQRSYNFNFRYGKIFGSSLNCYATFDLIPCTQIHCLVGLYELLLTVTAVFGWIVNQIVCNVGYHQTTPHHLIWFTYSVCYHHSFIPLWSQCVYSLSAIHQPIHIPHHLYITFSYYLLPSL